MNAIKSTLTHEKLLEQVQSVGPLDMTTISLVRLTTSLLHDDPSKFESLLGVCFDNGISPSQLYHALFSLVDVIGLSKVMQSISKIEMLIEAR